MRRQGSEISIFLVYFTVLIIQSLSDIVKQRACDILIGIDDVLYDLHERNLTELVDLAQLHVDRVNHIYDKAVFVDDFADVYFRLARVQVMFGSCDTFRYENCTENRDKFLEIFDQYDFKEFCLGFMFTYRDFDSGTAGLASMGTACKDRYNSGFITFLNYERKRALNDTVITFAHELAHSLGAAHDEDYDDEECNSKYIMSSFLNTTVTEEFSNCSVKAIQNKLEEILSSEYNCIKEPPDTQLQKSLCGNGIVEPGEECDCGYDEVECDDPCCYPAIISLAERNKNVSGALPCSRNQRDRCVSPPWLVYGIYIPLLFIFMMCVLISVFLRHDWTREKSLFRHVTEGNVRIIPANKRDRQTSRADSFSTG